MKKLFILFGIAVLTFGSIAFFILDRINSPTNPLSEQEKEDALAKTLGRKPVLSVRPEITGNTSYQGKNVSFSYPAKAKIYEYTAEDDAKNPSNIESFSFYTENPRVFFNLGVTENQSQINNLEDIPGARLRITRSYEYSRKDIFISKIPALIFTQKGKDASKTAFFIHDKKIFSLALTGKSEEYNEEVFDMIISSLKISP